MLIKIRKANEAGDMRYAICKVDGKIMMLRTDRNYDFGEVITYRETLVEAKKCAMVERMVLKRFSVKGTHDPH